MSKDLATWSPRWAALFGTVACAALLGVAAWMEPDPHGLGLNAPLGFSPCAGFTRWQLPCPTCGMCTAFSFAVRGQFLASFHAQPAGLVLFLATLACAALCLATLVTARVPRIGFLAWSMRTWIIVVAVILAGGWVYKCVTWYFAHRPS